MSNKNAHIIQNPDLEHGDEKRGEDRFSLLDPLNHVVEVGHAKEEGTNNYCLGRGHLKNNLGKGHFDKYSRERPFEKYSGERSFENKSQRTFSSPELACSV